MAGFDAVVHRPDWGSKQEARVSVEKKTLRNVRLALGRVEKVMQDSLTRYVRDRPQAERELSDSEDRLATAIAALPDGVVEPGIPPTFEEKHPGLVAEIQGHAKDAGYPQPEAITVEGGRVGVRFSRKDDE
ncbi:MAG: hypothetical protein IIC70_08275 [Acidobacteria bacterium]|nr:hypothetical protein [Acidobacteriota bacterium]